jgi:NAD(P)-dependent dehydrogenase (short-subunit alcohol dehydrogenase family)
VILNSQTRTVMSVGSAVIAGAALGWWVGRASRYSFAGKTVVITGGSRGLGLELARRWASEGARIAICARTDADIRRAVTQLERDSPEAEVIGCVCDVRSPNEIEHFIRVVIARWSRIDVLVNNAGIIQVGPLECMSHADYRDAMETHFWGPLIAIRTVVPYMLSKGGGRIVNISSIGGKVSVPHMLPYSASKFALNGLSEGLAAELAAKGISVTTVCPGLMRTGSPRNAVFKGDHRSEYAWFSISAALPLLSIGSSRAAGQIVEACRQNKSVLNLSLPCKFAVRAKGLMPGLSTKVLRLVNRFLPGPSGEEPDRSHRGDQSFSAWSPSLLTILNERAAAANNEIRSHNGTAKYR